MDVWFCFVNLIKDFYIGFFFVKVNRNKKVKLYEIN